MHLKKLSAKWQPFCPEEDELMFVFQSPLLAASRPLIRQTPALSPSTPTTPHLRDHCHLTTTAPVTVGVCLAMVTMATRNQHTAIGPRPNQPT